MNCRQCIEFLMDYLNGDLSPSEKTTFDEHLIFCPPCVEYLRQYEETVKLGKGCFTCGKPAPPGEPPEALIRAILAARPGPAKES
jgi:anti-sigma factor RsiW